jgi:hypothetical protein
MRKVVYSVAASLDGYVAGPNGEADWITMDPEIDFAAIFARFDTVLMGRKTYEAARAMGGGAMPGVTSIVASRTLRPEDCPGAAVIGGGLPDRVRDLRAGAARTSGCSAAGCCSGRCSTPGWLTRSGWRSCRCSSAGASRSCPPAAAHAFGW